MPTLKEVFAGQPDAPGALAGHEGLPDDLLVTAIGSYADTAPAEVAEHLAAFVAAPTGAEAGMHLLAAAPEVPEGEVALDGTPVDDDHLGLDGLGNADGLDGLDSLDALDHPPADQTPETTHDTDFGHEAAVPGHQPTEDHMQGDDEGHVPLEDLSHEVLAGEIDVDADPHHALDAFDELETEHHDDGHHDPGPDHFAG